jgi:predicted O-linked N-acetylglucosamine transferase (SPINDLY family)
VCYNNRWDRDEITARIAAASSVWRDVLGWSDEGLAGQIRADRVQILFDLSGHTAGNRLLTFARKPAPLQVTWIGYEGTTGLAAMDYILADGYEIPPHLENQYREKVLRMPEGYLCYDPPTDAPPVAPLPALQQGHVTFGSFNNLGKITPPVVRVWAEILRRIPGARLALKYRGLADENTRRRYLELFAAQGAGADRLNMLGWSPHPEFLAEHHHVDLALDPFPFSGSITSCAALWMGVPVITCPGETFASRHTFDHLSNIGLTETIAHDLDDYVRRAVELSGDLPRLAALRAGLRPRMAASPLCDGPRFARNLMELLRRVWRQKMETSPG